jgi:hypothetical protein
MKCTCCGDDAIVKQDQAVFDCDVKVNELGKSQILNKQLKGFVCIQLCRSCVEKLRDKYPAKAEETSLMGCLCIPFLFGFIVCLAFGASWNEWSQPVVNIIGIIIAIILGILSVVMYIKLHKEVKADKASKQKNTNDYVNALLSGFKDVSINDFISHFEDAQTVTILNCTIKIEGEKPQKTALAYPDKKEKLPPILPVSFGQLRIFINTGYFNSEYEKHFNESAPSWIIPLLEPLQRQI